MNIIYRKLQETDPEDIRQFNELMDDLTFSAPDGKTLQERIRKANNSDNCYLMVAEDADAQKLCGSVFAITFGDFCELCKPVMVIENVVIHHDYQGKGLGKRMLEQIENWGREQDAGYAILCSSLSREDAHKFYKAVGYEEVKGFKKFL